MKKAEYTLGMWMAWLSALMAILWFITFNMQDYFRAVPEWTDLEAYAGAYHISRLTLIYPSLLLAVTYVIMLSCLHRVVAEERKVWSLAALSIGIIYAVMAGINYNIQAVAVRLSLAAGETGGIAMFIPDNPHSVFTALANSYVYMGISMFLAAFVFGRGRLEGWIRGLLLVQAVSAAGQAGYSMFDWPEALFIGTSMVWVAGAPAAFILMGFWFRKKRGEI